MENQDWTPVQIHRRAGDNSLRPGVSRTSSGATQKKTFNHQAAVEHKLMNANEPVKLKTLTLASRKLIAQKRAEKTMTQLQLNTACSFPLNTVRDIEAGKYTPTPSQLSTMNHVLGTSMKLE